MPLDGGLAQYDYHLFYGIDQQGGYFISKVKDGANPKIVATNQTVPGRSIELEGKHLQEVVD
mgnify:CR=1 FL=1